MVGLRSTLGALVGLAGVLVLWWTFDRGGAVDAQEDEKHGGDIVFEVKKNRLKLEHSLFSHQAHLDHGHTCKDCHNDRVFKRERKLGINTFTMDDVMKGKACGSCHNGKTQVKGAAVFAPKDNCQRCHHVKFRRATK